MSAPVLRALAIIANPSPYSFSHAMAEAAAATLLDCGCQPTMRDLYAEGFDPVQRSGEFGNRESADAQWSCVMRRRKRSTSAHSNDQVLPA